MTSLSPRASEALHALAEDPDIRILRRVSPLTEFPAVDVVTGATRMVVLVDTETTGTDPLTDEVIDVAMVTIRVDAAGEIVEIMSAGEALRDPGFPIPAGITQLTGITDADVQGQAIELDRLQRLLLRADVRIAHNAAFDIAFLEQLMPGLAGGAWACSARDFDWVQAGFDGCKLGHLLMQAGHFNTAHRAMADVASLLHVLAHRLPDGSTVMGALLANAERPSVRFEAVGAPFEKRSLLKARGYRWDARERVWWIEVSQDDCVEEERWLRRQLGPFGPMPKMVPLTWHQRHR